MKLSDIKFGIENLDQLKITLQQYKNTDLRLSLSFIQGSSERIRNALEKFDINVYFKNDYKLENYITNKKDSENIENISNVVYVIKCKVCNTIFIGETGRGLTIKIAEHKKDCRIGNLNSGLSQHSWNFIHLFDFDLNNIEILVRENRYRKRTILESIFIEKHNKISSIL